MATAPNPTETGPGSAAQFSHSGRALRVLTWCIAGGAGLVLLYGARAASVGVYLTVVAVGLGVASASLLLGGVLGFVFGIPRTLQHEGGDGKGGEAGPGVEYLANTSLEQISDWLSKMLVGVGLTQLTGIPAHLWTVSGRVAAGLGDQPTDTVFVLVLIVSFSVMGFLFGYLWTRLYLARALRQADQQSLDALATRLEATDHKLEEFKAQAAMDAEALNLAYRQLHPSPQLPPVKQEELNGAVSAASRPIRVQMFNEAWRVRADNWRQNKPVMEATIPIFRALIHSDPDDRFHMNHGQLGFALKDSADPEWADAEKELSAAIEIRGPWEQHGWLFYEFNRAVCRIHLDAPFAEGKPSSRDMQDAILEDLRAAWESELKDIIAKDELIQKWLDVNGVEVEEP